MTYEQALIRDLHNTVDNLIDGISIHDNGENCPYCGTEYEELDTAHAAIYGDYGCPDDDCVGNKAFRLLTKSKVYLTRHSVSLT
tara:strand:+ start:111 stop:362 length:252 start_codon:yes stop_codon:yes gene_type:complete